MGIEIKEPTQEGYNHTLDVRGLAQGDYIILSVDGFREDNGKVMTYGKFGSILAFVDVFEYSFFNVDERKVVDVKLSQPIRCSYFMSEAIYNKIIESKIEKGNAIKIEMVATKTAGRTTYNIKKYDFSLTKEDKADYISKDDTTVEDVMFEEINLEDLKEQIEKFRIAKFKDEEIMVFLKGKFSERLIKENLK